MGRNDFNPEEGDPICREGLGPSVGESLIVRFDAAEEYDLTAGGNFTAVALGFIPHAEGSSTFLNGSPAAYYSNDVHVELQQAPDNSAKTARSRFITGVDVKDSCGGDLLAQAPSCSC